MLTKLTNQIQTIHEFQIVVVILGQIILVDLGEHAVYQGKVLPDDINSQKQLVNIRLSLYTENTGVFAKTPENTGVFVKTPENTRKHSRKHPS